MAAGKPKAIALEAYSGHICGSVMKTLGNTGGRYTELGERKKTAVSFHLGLSHTSAFFAFTSFPYWFFTVTSK